jgi:hypothetical protein
MLEAAASPSTSTCLRDSAPRRRYPVFYLLIRLFPHVPAFCDRGCGESRQRRRIRPVILVMPFGSTGTFTDKKWSRWPGEAGRSSRATSSAPSTPAHRTIPTARPAICGLSEGGYGRRHRPSPPARVPALVESWSGYEQADLIRSTSADRPRAARREQPAAPDRSCRWRPAPPARASGLLGFDDRLLGQNRQFAADLGRLGIPHRFLIRRGGHNWALWRGNAAVALLAATRHLA